jgi:antitoxin (DNA-binding transcriptional repressor) of toxin-antitoxin stability system
MKSVGVRDLKNRLSEYIRQVKAGESVLVTDRGQVVAELTAPGQGSTDANLPHGLIALSKRGLVTIGGSAPSGLYPALRPTRRRHRSRELLDEERGGR